MESGSGHAFVKTDRNSGPAGGIGDRHPVLTALLFNQARPTSDMRSPSFAAGIVGHVAVLLMAQAVAAAAPVVDRVSITPTSRGDGYVIRLHSSDYIHAFTDATSPASGRYEVVLFNAAVGPDYIRDEPEGPILHYDFHSRDAHLVFGFRMDASEPYRVDVYRDRGSNDLLVGLIYDPSAQGKTTQAVAPPTNGPSVQARDRWKLDTIVIDAGHGGKDAGAVSGGVREKEVVLEVGKKLGQYLTQQLGVRVVFTREDDRFIELKERGRIANEAGGKLFVSLHCNSARRRSAQGTETYFLGMHKSEAARDVMDRENSVVRFEENASEYENFDEQELIRMALAQSAYMHKSEMLASQIERQFSDRVQRNSRGVHQAGFYVLWSASMPAVLVELGFLTHSGERAFLASESGQAYMASAIFRAIRDFKNQYERELNITTTAG